MSQTQLEGGDFTVLDADNFAVSLTKGKYEVSSNSTVFFSVPYDLEELQYACNLAAAKRCEKNSARPTIDTSKYKLGTAFLIISYVNGQTGENEKLSDELYVGSSIYFESLTAEDLKYLQKRREAKRKAKASN